MRAPRWTKVTVRARASVWASASASASVWESASESESAAVRETPSLSV
jgi:hypothetical protein